MEYRQGIGGSKPCTCVATPTLTLSRGWYAACHGRHLGTLEQRHFSALATERWPDRYELVVHHDPTPAPVSAGG